MSKTSTLKPAFNREVPYNLLPDLPPEINLETPVILKATIKANRLLGELKGYCQTLPDPRLHLRREKFC